MDSAGNILKLLYSWEDLLDKGYLTVYNGVITNCPRKNISGMLILNSNITEIGAAAFRDCNKLSGINIPNSVKIIGTEAFYKCQNLSQVKISSKNTLIGYSAFYGCSEMNMPFYVPSSVTYIGEAALPSFSIIYDGPAQYPWGYASEVRRSNGTLVYSVYQE